MTKRSKTKTNEVGATLKDKAPPTELEFHKSFLELLDKEVDVRQRDGTTDKVSVRDAVLKKQLQTAMSGSPHAQNQATRNKPIRCGIIHSTKNCHAKGESRK